MRFKDRKTQVLDLIEKNKNLKEMLFGNDGKGPLKKLINSCIKLGFNPLVLNKTGQDTFDETRRALRKQCAVEEPAIGVGCRAKQATHHAVKSWWEARA